jgi:transcriptional regulator with XRE-family HTH domain
MEVRKLKDRFKELRETLSLTQQKFADRLDISRNFVAQIEMGNKIPSERTIKDICREFKVNYEWLTEGTGEMFIQNKRKSEIADFVGSVLNGEADSFKIRLVEILANLNESEWETLQKLANALADKKEE